MKRADRTFLIAALLGEASDEELRRLRRWRDASADNEEVYQRLRRLWRRVEQLRSAASAGRAPRAEEIIEIAEGPTHSVLELPSPRRLRSAVRSKSSVSKRMRVAVAAALVAALGTGAFVGAWLDRDLFGPRELVTGQNEVATVTLEDQTVVRLAPGSRVTFPSERGAREVSLEGRAYFAVSRLPGRPFRVRVSDGRIEVLGTRFDVESREGSLQVAVVEGSVGMSTRGKRVDVDAGHVARSSAQDGPRVERVEDVFEVIDWLGRFLAFESTPLEKVAEEFRRRFGIRIELMDDALKDRTVTGWFADQSAYEMLAGICRAVDARCTVRNDVLRMEAMGESRGAATLATTDEP